MAHKLVTLRAPRRVDDIAIFGGAPIFTSPRPIGQLAAPPVGDYMALVRHWYDARSNTAARDVVTALEDDLRALHGVAHCVAVANAGLGLMLLMRIFANGRSGDVLMPAFTFRGLPHFARWAGQRPRFCDVDLQTHGIAPASVAANLSDRTTAILAVNNPYCPCAIDELVAIAAQASVPILFDSVYAIGATYGGRPIGGFGAAEVFSCHATKLLNGFEGGYVTTNDADLAAALRAGRRRVADIDGLEAELTPLHAAMARVSLRDLDAVIDGNRERFDAYARVCDDIPGLRLVKYRNRDRERHNFEMAVLEVGPPWPLTRDETVNLLRAEGAAISAYYSPPLHRSPHAPPGVPVPELPCTERLTASLLQLPVGELMTLADIERLGDFLNFVRHSGLAIAERLRTNRT